MKYATKNLNNPLKSSAGLKLNILGLTVTANLSLDNIGISGSVKNGDVTKSSPQKMLCIMLMLKILEMGYTLIIDGKEIMLY